MNLGLLALHLLTLLALPFLITGLVNRTKALWAGRKGPPLLQSYFDVMRLLRKRPVYSSVTTPVFRLGPIVVLASVLASGAFIPLLRDFSPLRLPFDFVAAAYLWGLGRIAMTLAALDTGSAFEGMGASREATYGALAEPALFLGLGTLSAATGQSTFAGLLHLGFSSPDRIAVAGLCAVAFFIVLLVEAARVPVDDPNTHLELTMIHEVMILDHSGPELAALQYTAAMKMTICAALVAGLINPLTESRGPVLVGLVNVALMATIAIGVGCVESLIARLKLRSIPQFIAVALVATLSALLVTAWAKGSIG
jgi:formate hydrogenlyase subunit 4